MTEFPRCSDLQSLAAEVAGNPSYRRLSTAIRKAMFSQSCRADLAQAQAVADAASTLQKSARGKGSVDRHATEAALLYTAISLYVRATWSATKKGDRGSSSIIDAIDAEQTVANQSLIDVRNKAFAHVYPGRQVAGDVWHSSEMIAVETSEGWLVGGSSRATLHHGPIWTDLYRMLPVASAIIKARVIEEINKVSEILNDGKLPVGLLLKSLVDPVALFGSEKAARNMMPGGPGIAFETRVSKRP